MNYAAAVSRERFRHNLHRPWFDNGGVDMNVTLFAHTLFADKELIACQPLG